MRSVVALLALALPAFAEEIKAGPLTLTVHVSRTANLFEIVDNLSNWDRYAHAQYVRHFEKGITEDDRALLEEYAANRRRHGWDGKLEQTFLTDLELEPAIARGLAKGHIGPKEAARLEAILLHFAPRVDALFTQEKERLEAFREKLATRLPELESFAGKVSRFCHGRKVTVPVFLIANPADNWHGGGYNGGRLTLEVARKADVFPTFLHELMHAFVNEERTRLSDAIQKVDGLDYTTLNEGIAYALSPGIYHAGTDLASQAASDYAKNGSMDDQYVRFRRYGLALEPLLRDALDDESATLATFLPRALDAWRVLSALEGTRTGAKRSPLIFSSGPAYKTLAKRADEKLYSFDHSADHYRRILRRAKKGETFVLLFALDSADRKVPAEFKEVLPRAWAEIERELRAGKTLELTGKWKKLRTVLLAAPTVAALEELIRVTPLLDPPGRGRWFFSLGVVHAYGPLNDRVYELHGVGVVGRSHGRPYYREVFRRARSGDVLVLLFTRNERGVLDGYEDLLPRPWKEIQAALDSGKEVELAHKARDLDIVVLAAPTKSALLELVRRTRLLALKRR